MNCLVRINSTTIMSTGGSSVLTSDDGMVENTDRTRETSFYNSDKDTWTEGPKMNLPRHGHSCALMTFFNPSSGTTVKAVVVAGGNLNEPSSVEGLRVDLLEEVL